MLRLIIVFVLCSVPVFAQAQKESKKPLPEWAIVLNLAPQYQDDTAWKEEDNKAVGEHFVALQKLQKEGKLVIAGRTTNKASLGIIVLKGMTEAEARTVMNNDKAIQRGIMKAELLPFYTALKEVAQ